MRDRVDDVAGSGLALRPDHRRALGDPAERLAEVGRAADERDGERVLVDVVLDVRGSQHLGLVDVVDLERLEDLRLDEVADAALRHHRDRHGLLDLADLLRIRHAGDAPVPADVGRDALERHHRARARLLGDPRLVGVDDVHDDPALQHLGEARLDAQRADLGHALSVAGRLPRQGRGARRSGSGGLRWLFGACGFVGGDVGGPRRRRCGRRLGAVPRAADARVRGRRSRAVIEVTRSRTSAKPSPAACMFIHAPTTITIARIRPSQAQNVRNSLSARNLMTVNEDHEQHREAAVIIDGVTANLEVDVGEADRLPDDQRDQRGGRRGRPTRATCSDRRTDVRVLELCQLKKETMRNAIAAPRTTFAPWDSSASLSILRTFPFRGGRLTLALCNAM